jgi:Uncharacterized protein conserved in bacteria (DUF2252)
VLLDRYRVVDAARKVVGVGSVGTRCHVALLMDHDDGAPLFLQVKEAEASVLAPYAGPSAYRHQGERVVTGQRLMQAASDVFLGWATGPYGHDYYVRQLRDMKGSVAIDALTADELVRYSFLCGITLARAHARSGDAAAISGYLGKETSSGRPGPLRHVVCGSERARPRGTCPGDRGRPGNGRSERVKRPTTGPVRVRASGVRRPRCGPGSPASPVRATPSCDGRPTPASAAARRAR